jgi:hypothetical protein
MMDAMEYAGAYQARRKARCATHNATFLPMEALRHIATDQVHLSVSFSGTGVTDTYFTQVAEYYRVVQVRMKWFVVPTTVSQLLTKEEFLRHFGDLLDTTVVDDEAFWVLRKEHDAAVRERIASFDLDNAFRAEYHHAYLPDADSRLA